MPTAIECICCHEVDLNFVVCTASFHIRPTLIVAAKRLNCEYCCVCMWHEHVLCAVTVSGSKLWSEHYITEVFWWAPTSLFFLFG